MRSSDLDSRRASDAASLDLLPSSAEAQALTAVLRTGDPLRAGFDGAVRCFVRAERQRGRELEGILATLGRLLHAHLAPSLGTARHRRLRDAARWFAVSEFHRAD